MGSIVDKFKNVYRQYLAGRQRFANRQSLETTIYTGSLTLEANQELTPFLNQLPDYLQQNLLATNDAIEKNSQTFDRQLQQLFLPPLVRAIKQFFFHT